MISGMAHTKPALTTSETPPGPIRWLWYAFGGALGPRYRKWVLHDLTSRTRWVRPRRRAGRARRGFGVARVWIRLDYVGGAAGWAAVVADVFRRFLQPGRRASSPPAWIPFGYSPAHRARARQGEGPGRDAPLRADLSHGREQLKRARACITSPAIVGTGAGAAAIKPGRRDHCRESC